MRENNLATGSSVEQSAPAVGATSLDWLPLDVPAYLQRTALLSLAEEGALNRALVTSWNAALRGDAPGTLPDCSRALERLFGPEWESIMPVIRQHFVPDSEHPGRLRCAWFADLFARQQCRHRQSVEKGKRTQEFRRKKREEWRRKQEERRRKSAPNVNNANSLSSTVSTTESSTPSLTASRTPSSAEIETSFENKIPFGGSPSEIPPKGDAPDVAAVGRGGATSAPPSPAPSAPPPQAPPAPRELSRVRRAPPLPGRTALMRDVAPSDHREPDDGPTTAQLEHWLRSRPDAEAAFTQTWQSMADEDPHAEPGFLRVPALRSTWRALRDAPLPAHSVASGAA